MQIYLQIGSTIELINNGCTTNYTENLLEKRIFWYKCKKIKRPILILRNFWYLSANFIAFQLIKSFEVEFIQVIYWEFRRYAVSMNQILRNILNVPFIMFFYRWNFGYAKFQHYVDEFTLKTHFNMKKIKPWIMHSLHTID